MMARMISSIWRCCDEERETDRVGADGHRDRIAAECGDRVGKGDWMSIFREIKFLVMFMMYLSSKREDRILWMLAEDKGMLCTGLRNGVAEFDPKYPPQEEPKKAIGYRDFRKKMMEK